MLLHVNKIFLFFWYGRKLSLLNVITGKKMLLQMPHSETNNFSTI